MKTHTIALQVKLNEYFTYTYTWGCVPVYKNKWYENSPNRTNTMLITKTRLFKYIENLTTKKTESFHKKKNDIVIFLLKT